MILTDQKQLVLPPGLFHSLEEAMRLSRPEDGHNLDLQMVLEVKDANGFSQGRQRRQCHSFLKQFIDFLVVSAREGYMASKDWAGNARTIYGTNISGYPYWNFDMTQSIVWHGPCVGTGTTAPTINDFQLEQPVWHGTAQPNASAESGTYTSRSWSDPTFTVTHSGKAWSTNAWANYLFALTSGAASGLQFRINSNTATVLTMNGPGSGHQPHSFSPIDPGATANYAIKTYGQLSYSSISWTAPTDDGDKQSRFSISRDFTNSQGATFTVNECGLLTSLNVGLVGPTYTYAIPFLMIRDVLSPGVELLNTQVLTLTYDMIVNA